MENPLVSIICITYNHENFISQAIEGFIIQKTDFPIEIIIHDDCSTDNTQKIIKEYVDIYPDLIKPIYQKENQYSLGKKIAPSVFPYCRGKYIALCEGDDFWTDPDKLQRQVAFLKQHSEYIMVTENSIWHDLLRNTQVQFSQLPERDINILEMLEKRQFATASVLFRNLGKELNPGETSGDTILWCHLTKFGKIRYLQNISSVYQRHSMGVTEGDKVKWAKRMTNWNIALSRNHPEINSMVFKKRNLQNYKDAINFFIQKNLYTQALITIEELINLTDDSDYYKKELYIYIDNLLLLKDKKLEKKHIQINQAHTQINDLQNSLSYRIGRAITYPIRWVYDIPKKSEKIKYNIELLINKNKRELKDKGVTFINRNKIIKASKNLKPLPAVKKNKTPKLIVSLTSFPERIPDIFFNLYSLFNQTIQPDMLILWLAEEQFPNKEKDLPKRVLNLKQFGLTIRWCSDLKSYKKLVFSLKEFPEDIIVTADDDIYYPENWLELLYTSYLREPQYIHCHRAHSIKFNDNNDLAPYNTWPKGAITKEASHLNFCTTGGGTLYPPRSLYKDVLNQKLFLQLCPTADDIWFWAMAVLNNTKIRVVDNNIIELIYIDPELQYHLNDGFTLYKINLNTNDKQLTDVMKYYKKIKNSLSFHNH